MPRFAKGVDLQQALEHATADAAFSGNQGTCTACVVRYGMHMQPFCRQPFDSLTHTASGTKAKNIVTRVT